MGPKTLAELVKEYGDLAAEVNRDMPGATLQARMREAMRRNKGSMNPLWVQEALIRSEPAPSGSTGEEG